MWICWMMEGRVSRERIAAPLAERLLEHMRAEYPGVLWWLCRDDDGMEWPAH